VTVKHLTLAGPFAPWYASGLVTTDTATSSAEARRQENRKDARAAAVFTIGRSVANLLIAVTYIVAAAVYEPVQLAYVTAVLLLVETSIALGSLGLPDVVFYFIGRYPDRSAAIVRQTSLILLFAAVIVVPIVIGVAVVISGSDGELDLIPALPWLALIVLVELPTQPAVNQLIAHGYAGSAAILYAWFALLRLIACLTPAVTGWSSTSIPIAMALLGMTHLIAHLWILRRVYPLAPGQKWVVRAQLKEIFYFALPSGVQATVSKLNPQIDKYAVEFMLGAEVLALYSVAALELPLVTMIPYAIGAVMQVRYVRLYLGGQREELRALWYQTVEKTMVLVVPLAVIFIVMAPDLIGLVYAPKYAVAIPPFQIFTVVLLHRVAAYGPMLQATNQQRLLIVSSLLIVVSNLVMQYPMTRLFGINGPAIATAVANVPAWLFVLHRIGRALGDGIRIALPWRFYARTLVVAGALGAVLYLVRERLHFHHAINLAIGVIGYAIAFVVVGRLTGVLKREDTMYLKRVLSFGVLR
jgi:O-antigen/teichoic acid export membrane protein